MNQKLKPLTQKPLPNNLSTQSIGKLLIKNDF